MYLIEGEENGFTSIPESVYWTIVTLTTVDMEILRQVHNWKVYCFNNNDYGLWNHIVPLNCKCGDSKRRRPDKYSIMPHCAESSHKDNAKFCHSCGNILNDEE